MSTAVLISGQLRTFAKCWPTQRWHVLRHFEDPHFFITVQRQSMETLRALIEEYGVDRVHIDMRDDPDLTEQITPELSAAYHLAPYTNAAPAHQLLLQHWYQNECWKFFQSFLTTENTEITEKGSGSISVPSVSSVVKGLGSEKFDTIIRLRADLWFHSFEDPRECPKPRINFGCIDNIATLPSECFTPGWGEFGGINDRFSIMGPEAAKYYFTTYGAIPELLAAGCPFHPESLVAANLERGNINILRSLKTFFSTERIDGSRRWPEITPMDMFHAALTRAA